MGMHGHLPFGHPKLHYCHFPFIAKKLLEISISAEFSANLAVKFAAKATQGPQKLFMDKKAETVDLGKA